MSPQNAQKSKRYYENSFLDHFTLRADDYGERVFDNAGKRFKDEFLDMVEDGRMELIGMYMQPDTF